MKDKILQDRYKITEYIGCGGMAQVYKALDLVLEREVAVKILRSQFAGDANFIKKFRREAQAAGGITDSNIVSIFDVGEQDGIHYIIMEYVPGETLQKLLNQKTALDYNQAIFIATGIAKALSKAHASGIVHCDIKPHNILIDENGNPKVSDFGIAHAISSCTMTFEGSILGSIHYLSPEQAKGQHVTFSSDIYSLGIVFFEMLTGKLPFMADTPIAIAMQHAQSVPPVLREFKKDVPAVLESIVSKALAKNPKDRFKNAEEFIQALNFAQAYIEGQEDYLPEDATIFLDATINEEKSEYKKPYLNKLMKFWNNKVFRPILLTVLLILGFLVGSFLVFGNLATLGEVKVPDVTGKSKDDAIKILQKASLDFTIVEEFNDKIISGVVINQSPEQGSIVKEKRKIDLIVSKGAELFDVPDIVGIKIDQAEQVLQKKSLHIGKIEEKDEKDKPPGTILSQNPAVPSMVGINAKIDVVIVTTDKNKVAMADLSGMTLEVAKEKLTSLKLKLKDVQNRFTSAVASGIVVGQSPAPEQPVMQGSEVTLVIARAIAEQERQEIIEFIVPKGAREQDIQIVVTDNKNRRVVYNENHNPGERIRKNIEGIGSVRVQFYSNGKLIEEKYI